MASQYGLSFSVLTADEVDTALDDLARLRTEVFADWPYLYDGDADYEAQYLKRFAASPGAVVVAARDVNGLMVGAATAAPLSDHADEFAVPFARVGLDPDDFFLRASMRSGGVLGTAPIRAFWPSFPGAIRARKTKASNRCRSGAGSCSGGA